MIVRPIEHNIIFYGTDMKASVTLSPKQKWEKIESKVPGYDVVQKKEVKLMFLTEDFKRYFREDSV